MKIASSLLATVALAQSESMIVGSEIDTLGDGCLSLMKSSAFSGNLKWQKRWILKCQKQHSRKQTAYDRCGEYEAGYSVQITKNVETETCEAISELASENIRWVDAHIVNTLCENRVQKITKRMNNWENKLRALIDCPALETEETVVDPKLGYQTTVPEAFAFFDSYDGSYPEGHYLFDFYPDNFDVGDTITLSKRCVEDWDAPGNGYGCIVPVSGFSGSQIDWDIKVAGYCAESKDNILFMAVKDTVHPDQFITMLNCPQCGCTLGEYDAPEIDDRSHLTV